MEKKLVVTFPFGDPGTNKSNSMIAIIGSDYAQDEGCPIYVSIDVCADEHLELVWVGIEKGESPSTLGIARGAVEWAVEHWIAELWVVTAEPLLETATRNLEEEIRKAGADIVVCVCPKVSEIPSADYLV